MPSNAPRVGLESDARLTALRSIAVRAGANGLASETEELARRVVEGGYYVACVGQFKRGKSTLLNALVGAPVLPTGVVPITSAITLLRYGSQLDAAVHYEDGRSEAARPEELSAFVSEAENPGNAKRVRWVEVFAPHPLLRDGMCLVDTPGLGSVFADNTGVTERFLPQIDAALVVIGADPPISGDELELVAQVATTVRHLVFVLNKADRVPEHDVTEGARFAERVISERLRRPVGPVLEVSAAEAVGRGPTRQWRKLELTLARLAHDAGAELVRAAEVRGTHRIAHALLRELDERERALLSPLEQTERHLAELRRSVEQGEQALADLGVLLQAEQNRLAREFRDSHETFFPRAQEKARTVLSAEVRALAVSRRRLRAQAFIRAQHVARDAVDEFRRELEPPGEEMYRTAMQRFVQLANEFLARLRSSSAPGLDSLPDEIGPELRLRAPSHVYYTEILDQTLSPVGALFDILRPHRRAVRAVLRRVSPYLERLIETNSSRVANDLVERVQRSREALEHELRQALRQVTGAAERAITRAQSVRASGAAAVRDEAAQLAELRAEVLLLLHSQGEAT